MKRNSQKEESPYNKWQYQGKNSKAGNQSYGPD